MMNSDRFAQSVFVTDYTNYFLANPGERVPSGGVVISVDSNALLPSFKLTDRNKVPFIAINLDNNISFFRHTDGSIASHCEAVFYAEREHSPAWMLLLELKYCGEKNGYDEFLNALSQLKATCSLMFDDLNLFDSQHFKRYFAVSFPLLEDIAPFDASFFDQEDRLLLKEQSGAILFITNQVDIHTPVHLKLPVSAEGS